MVKACYDAVGGGIDGNLVLQTFYKAAFDFVADPKDWRAPIDALVSDYEACSYSADVIVDAVRFFTSTHCTYTRVANGLRFEAIGYRGGPCGP